MTTTKSIVADQITYPTLAELPAYLKQKEKEAKKAAKKSKTKGGKNL